MTTGYTYPVAKGEITTFKDFAAECAKAFGARLSKDVGGPLIVEKAFATVHVSDYYYTHVNETRDELNKLLALTDEELPELYKAEYKEVCKRVKEWNDDNEAQKRVFGELLEFIEAWIPPTSEHDKFKAFMIQQVTDSIPKYEHEYPPVLTPLEWHHKELKRAMERMTDAEKDLNKQIERAATANEWLSQLAESLNDFEKDFGGKLSSHQDS